MTSVPPASTRAGPVAPASSATAACSVSGASYLRSVIPPPMAWYVVGRSCREFAAAPSPPLQTATAPALAYCHCLLNNKVTEIAAFSAFDLARTIQLPTVAVSADRDRKRRFRGRTRLRQPVT